MTITHAPEDLMNSSEAVDAIVDVLRILAARGRAVREGKAHADARIARAANLEPPLRLNTNAEPDRKQGDPLSSSREAQ